MFTETGSTGQTRIGIQRKLFLATLPLFGDIYVLIHSTLQTELLSEEVAVSSLSSFFYSQAEWKKTQCVPFYFSSGYSCQVILQFRVKFQAPLVATQQVHNPAFSNVLAKEQARSRCFAQSVYIKLAQAEQLSLFLFGK